MKIDLKVMGERIKKERTAAGFKTQAKFAKAMGYVEESRTTVGNWESGHKQPVLDDLLKMCEMFGCELEYLLGKYPCRTRQATDIEEVTGLSEEAIEKLAKLKYNFPDGLINSLICDDFLELFLRSIQKAAQYEASHTALRWERETGKNKSKAHMDELQRLDNLRKIERYEAHTNIEKVTGYICTDSMLFWLKEAYGYEAKYEYSKKLGTEVLVIKEVNTNGKHSQN